MTRLTAVFDERNDARERVSRSLGGVTPLTAPGFAAAWRPGTTVDSARAGDVTCVVAGPSAVADGLARDYGRDALDLRSLSGAFTVILWDDRRRRGLVATDPLGVLAPVYRRNGARLAVALEPRDLLPLLASAPGPDELALVRWLGSGSTRADETLYSGVERLPGGHVVELRAGIWSPRRYHRFRYRGTIDGSRGELEHLVRDAVGQAVEVRLGEPESTGVLLSGGLDSTVVAATAAGLRGQLPSYSLVFPEHPQVDERRLIDASAAELDLEPTLLPASGGALLPAAVSFIDEWAVPPVSPTLAIQLPLLQSARATGATRLLDGQGGDELFDTPLYLLADLLRDGRLRRAWALSHRIPGFPPERRRELARRALREFGLKGALPHGAHGRRRRWAPPWFAAGAASLYREGADPWAWKRLDGPRWWAALLDSLTEQRERAGAHDYLRRRNALAGVDGGHPLLQDLDLIELVLQLPPELAFDETYDRPLLRSAIPALPEAIRGRAEKAYFTPLLLEAVDVHDASELQRILTADDAAIRAYTQPDLVREHLLDPPLGRRGEQRAWGLWRLAVAELWLRSL